MDRSLLSKYDTDEFMGNVIVSHYRCQLRIIIIIIISRVFNPRHNKIYKTEVRVPWVHA